jgi:hypothetical protein
MIRDDMPLLQSINSKRFRTFGEMALDFVKNQISCFQFTSVVVDIFDRYDIQNSKINWPGKVISLLGENCSDEYAWQCNRREI